MAQWVKDLGDTVDAISVPGCRRIPLPWRRKWQPTPVYFAWEIPGTEEPGWLLHGVTKSQKQLSDEAQDYKIRNI